MLFTSLMTGGDRAGRGNFLVFVWRGEAGRRELMSENTGRAESADVATENRQCGVGGCNPYEVRDLRLPSGREGHGLVLRVGREPRVYVCLVVDDEAPSGRALAVRWGITPGVC